MKAAYLSEKFSIALPYDRYVATGNEEQQRRWKQVYDAARLNETQTQLVSGFVRDMKILIVSGIWCGDCVQQRPLIQRIAESNAAKIDLRLLDRDQHRDLTDQVRMNAGDRVPVVLLLSEDYEWCATAGTARSTGTVRSRFGSWAWHARRESSRLRKTNLTQRLPIGSRKWNACN